MNFDNEPMTDRQAKTAVVIFGWLIATGLWQTGEILVGIARGAARLFQ
jgi:hypothetical protein